jgi:UDP-GlcNAc:undecaprenyl-phosphate/decaprenyl-phosphate GlcNAc-1-phosphate transferase
MAVQLAAAITSFVIAFLIVPVIIKYSIQRNLVDIPGRRKIHKKETPSMGGIAIFVGFFISSLIWIDITGLAQIKFFLVALFVIFFIGVRDDLVPLKAMAKLIGQLMSAALVIFLFGLRIKSFYGVFGIHELSEPTSIALTFLVIIVITNSFNLIDGLDGLAGTLAICSLLAFGIWFFLIDDLIFSMLSFSMLGAIFAFLIFNWQPSEVFMGDTGALVIGMILAMFTIYFIDKNFNLDIENPYRFHASIGTSVCFIIIPLIDTLRIVILRLLKKQSPFRPDKSHIHHSLLRLGFTHATTTLILGGIQVLFILGAIVLKEYGELRILGGAILVALVLSLTLDRLIMKKLTV